MSRSLAGWTLIACVAAGCAGEPVPDPPSSPSPSAATAERAPEAAMAMHDHTPRHGGIVGMAGTLHLEARADAGGAIELWITDFWRTPVPLADVRGTVTVPSASGAKRVPLEVFEGRLRAAAERPDAASIEARFELELRGEPVLIEFSLPVEGGARGAAGVPLDGCLPVPREEAGASGAIARAPRCALRFRREISVLAADARGDRLLVGALDAGVSVWAMPAVSLQLAFAPPPAIAVAGAGALVPHPEAPGAIAVHPDGSEAVVALEDRLLRYATRDGSLLRELAPAAGVVRDLAWAPDGSSLLVATFYDASARLVRTADGRPLQAFAVRREASAVAFAAAGRLVAVASELGGLTIFDAATGRELRAIDAGGDVIEDLASAADRGREVLLGGGRDGILRAWDVATGTAVAASAPGRPIRRVAVAPAGDAVAVSGYAGELRLLRPGGTAIETLPGHGSTVNGLAWAGDLLVSGDSEGRVLVWEASREATK